MIFARLRPVLLLLVAATQISAQVPVAEMPAALSTVPVAHVERSRTYDVLHYVVDLRFDERGRKVSGRTTVRLAPLADGFRDFALDAAELDVTAVQLETGAAVDFQVDAAAEALRVTLDRDYRAGEPLGVVVTYSATPRRGLYFFTRAAPPDEAPAQFWSQGETNDNHFWFPCWDYPNDKATAEVLMTINKSWAGVSNGALVSTRRNADGTKTLHWRQTQPNATYLLMVAAGEFTEIKDRWRGRPVTYVVPSSKAAAARRFFGRTPQMMEFFSKKIGYDYPWAKYSQIAVTRFMFGGMENTSATTISETSVRDHTIGYKSTADSLVAHELAHQWWGDLVTCRDWSHAWLNEGFATYFALLWTEHHRGRAAFRQEVSDTAREYMQSPVALSRPLVYNVYRRPFDLFFDGVIYPKGALVLHMLRGVVGDDAFWRGMGLYARRHEFGSVTTDDFQAAIEEASGQQLGWFFDQWARGIGYPRFEVTSSWSAETKQVTMRVRQTQEGDAVPVFRMPVDVRIATAAGERTERVVVDARENVFTFAADAKPKSVAFDPDNWLLKQVDVETTTGD